VRRDQELIDLVGENIRRVRLRRGLTQANLARRSGISAKQLGRIERGEYEPLLTNLLRVSAALGVDPGELLDGLPLPRA
jgi:transcriptional regulator with XRE-family HTH domain